jgi:hypothetical protein
VRREQAANEHDLGLRDHLTAISQHRLHGDARYLLPDGTTRLAWTKKRPQLPSLAGLPTPTRLYHSWNRPRHARMPPHPLRKVAPPALLRWSRDRAAPLLGRGPGANAVHTRVNQSGGTSVP